MVGPDDMPFGSLPSKASHVEVSTVYLDLANNLSTFQTEAAIKNTHTHIDKLTIEHKAVFDT